MFNISFKSFFGVRNYFIWGRIPHVLIIMASNIGSVGAVLIDKPSTVEAAFFQQRNMMSEFSYGGVNDLEARYKNFVDVLRPIRQQGEKLSINSCAKDGTRNNSSVMTFAPKIEEKSNASASNSKQPKVSGSEIKTENIHPSIYLWFAIIIAELTGLNSLVLKIPNDQGKRRRALAPSSDQRERF